MSRSPITEAEASTARRLCYAATPVFAACTALQLFTNLTLRVRAVGAGFNLIVALATPLYARTLVADDSHSS